VGLNLISAKPFVYRPTFSCISIRPAVRIGMFMCRRMPAETADDETLTGQMDAYLNDDFVSILERCAADPKNRRPFV
jgi:hypothetical protein